MKDIFNFKNILTLRDTDILVIGAGSAGCVAAIAAAKSKRHKVMLVEKYGFPGGTSTQMLDTFYGFFTPGNEPLKIVSGIPDEVVNELNKTGDIFLRPNTYGAGTGVNYNPERLKLVWDRLILSHKIDYCLHTILIEAFQEGEELITCVFWSKGNFFKINARRVIDASGDAEFCYHYGLDFETAGEKEPAQSMTTTFRMCNVDLNLFEQAGGKKMLQQKMIESVNEGRHPLPRKEGSAHEMCMPKCISTVAVKVANLSPLKTDDLTKAEIEGRRQAFIFEEFFRDEVEGYKDAKIIGLSNQIGIRETRRVYGEKRLTKEDCMRALIPDDSILLCGAPIEDHRKGTDEEDETVWEYIPGAGVYGVPYGTIVPRKQTRCWVVGRCFSATHDAHASCRSMAQTMSMGQAAGLAADLSLEHDYAANELNVNLLREKLFEMGATLEIPTKKADTRRHGWSMNL